MAFQIVYIFKAIDKFTKVAAKIEKSVGKIEKRVKGATQKVSRFQMRGVRAFRKISRQIDKSTIRVVKFGRQANKSFKSSAKNINHAERQFEKFNRRQKQTSLHMRLLDGSVGRFKSRLASLVVTMAMTGLGFNKIIETGKKIDSSMKNFSALTGIAGKDLERLRVEAHKFAKIFGIPADQIFVAFKRVAGLKPELIKDVDALKELTKWTLILDAPIDQLEKTARALTVALNIYGKSAENAAKFSNILAGAARFGSAEVNEIALSFLKAGTVAKTVAKIPFLDLIATIETIARAGLLAQISGVGLRTVMIRLQKAGFDFEKVGVAGVFAEIKKELDAIQDPTKRAWRAFQLFGLRQQAVGLALADNVPLLKQLKKDLSGTNIATETANTVLTAYEKKSEGIWAIWGEQADEIFESLQPALLELQHQWVTFLRALDAGVPGGLATIASLAVEFLADILSMINAILLGIAIIKSPFGFLRGFDAGMKGLEDIGRIWDLLMTERPTLETILKPEEKTSALSPTPAPAGRVSVDLNLRGNTEAVAGVRAETEGEVDFNTGANLAFIGS